MDKPDIDQNRVDVAASVARGILGQLPYVGSIVSEIVGAIIPNQRVDRLSRFAKILDEKLEGLDRDLLEQKMRSEEFVDLFEDVVFQAARTLTDERKEHIASLLKNSLSSEELDHVQEKQLLSILGELNDAGMVILKHYGLELDPQESQEFLERHEDTIRGPLLVMGSPQDEADRGAIHETYRSHLRRLGLVRANYKKPKKGESPEWDLKTGMIKASGDRITLLGRLLLRYIDAEVTVHSTTE